MARLSYDFFQQDALDIAPLLLGKKLVRVFENGTRCASIISEVEVYRGEEDTACHACKGRTKRTDTMYYAGGVLYVYLIYGMYWMLNIVTGKADNPQALLIRGVDGTYGPGKVGKLVQLDKSFDAEDLVLSPRIWVEDMPEVKHYITLPRVGIDYATEKYRTIPWRFVISK
ncbi:MAG: DNA-3-methyladenine glycosylase [Paludibacteraceae bacterium]|nr:DNA-3-methyladenine glycosylase [Paludibacteraceae bacterium]MBN2788449.1 DNA-3-methyladenine glycosylase [Paludibacteraceae bacterium]